MLYHIITIITGTSILFG